MKMKLAMLAIATFTFAGCGGGGSSGSSEPTATTYPALAAMESAYTNGMQTTLNVTGTANNGTTSYPVTGALTFTLGKVTNSTFNGSSALQSTGSITGSLTLNGQNVPFNSSSLGYLNAQYVPIGSSTTGSYCVSTAIGSYPANATAGQTGELTTFACYTDSTKSVSTGGQKQSYVTTAGSAFNTLDIKVLSSIYDSSNKVTASGSTTYTITSTGAPKLSRFEFIATTNGVTLSFVGQ